MEPKSTQVYEALKEDVLKCYLRPGQLIVESELAERYGTSKTPVRQALNRLAIEDLVDILPRRGSVVRQVTIQDVQHVYLLRRLLEPETAALAARRAKPADVERLELLEEAWRRDDAEGAAHSRFHVAVAEIAGVPRLTSIIDGLHTQMQWFLGVQALYGGGAPPKYRHAELIGATRAGDPVTARDVSERSIATSNALMIESVFSDASSHGTGAADPMTQMVDLRAEGHAS